MIDPPEAATGRKEEILATAADIFWAKGYHATSMNDLAAAMTMRKASLYHHISSKERLLYEISLSSMQHIIAAIGTANDADPEARLRLIVGSHIKALLSDRSRHATGLVELRSLLPDQRREILELRRQYDGLIDAALLDVQRHTGRWAGQPVVMVRLALLGMLNWTVFWFNSGKSQTPDGIAESFSTIFMPTLTTVAVNTPDT